MTTPTTKILEKLQKIKAHAEGAAAIGNEAEAQAFAEKLQEMLYSHRLEMSDLDFEEMEREQPVERQPIRYPSDLKVKRQRVPWRERLTIIIARAHFCRTLVSSRSSQMTLIGRREDIEIAEYMVVTLMNAARKLSKTAEANYFREVGRRELGFRDSWLNAFIERLEQRFAELRNQHAATSETALVRVNRSEQAVRDYMRQFKSAAPVKFVPTTHGEGYRRGVAAANQINLSANALKTSTQQKLRS